MRSILILSLLAPAAFSQLLPHNESGVTMGHIHFMATDPEAHKKIWMEVFGATTAKFGALETLKLPGIYLIVGKANNPLTGGTNGSVVNHVGIAVQDYPAVKAKLAALNVAVMDLTPNQQGFASFPDDVRIEFFEEKTIATPAAFHHIHNSVVDQEVARAWYVKHFGAGAGSRRNAPAAMIPGGEVDFIKSREAQAATKGRSLDHIGFEVKDLEATMKRLAADGVTIDAPLRDMRQQIGLKIAFVVDPLGTRIELTEGFAGR